MRPASLLLGVASLLLAVAASAQCHAPALGALIGTGDDVVLPIQPIGFAFPFGGTTYTDCHISTNGAVYLSNGGVPAPGTSLVTSSAALLAGGPKIVVRGQDLVVNSSNGAGCHLSSLGTHTQITWCKVNEFGDPTLFTAQLALYPNGDFSISYGPEAVRLRTTAPCIVGCSEGGGAADPGAANLSGSISFGASFYEIFERAAVPFDLGNATHSFTATPTGYDRLTTCQGAVNWTVGEGCTRSTIAFYEHFPGNTDLEGTTLTLTQNAAGGYTTSTAPLSTFGVPTATGLALTDESTASYTLPFSFDFPGGSTTGITITSNGRIYLSGTGSSSFSVSPSSFLAMASPVLCPAWVDMEPDGTTNVRNVYVDQINSGQVNITWLDVPCFPGTASSSGLNRFQVVLVDNGTSDYVKIRYDQLDPTTTSGVLIGFTPGGATVDPGEADLSAGPITTGGAEAHPLKLSASPIPVFGSVVTFTVDHIRPAGASGIAIVYASFFPSAPTPLSTLGLNAPGCAMHIDLLAAQPISPLLVGAPTDSVDFTVPNAPAWTGAILHFQAACLAPGENPAGVAVSNRITSYWEAF